MSYEVVVIPSFKKQLKKLAKKYPSIKTDFALLVEALEQAPTKGKALGNRCYKVRMAISSKGKGKSGGARVITYVQVTETTVYLLSIFDKSDKVSISTDEIKELLAQLE